MNFTLQRHGGRKILALTALTLASTQASLASGGEISLIVTGTLTGLIVVLLFFIVFALNGNIDPLVNLLRRLWTYVVPSAKEKVYHFDEDYDGIAELDNRVPPWFNYLFAASIVFAAVYLLDYHVFETSPLPASEYRQELEAADLQHRVRTASEGSIDEDALAALTDKADLEAGHDRFMRNCASCHGTKGEGLVGPNLTDSFWIHGGGIRNIYLTIKNGIPAKGMISWKLVFTPKELQQVASYVVSIHGSNPPNAKKPEGTPAAVSNDSTRSGSAL